MFRGLTAVTSYFWAPTPAKEEKKIEEDWVVDDGKVIDLNPEEEFVIVEKSDVVFPTPYCKFLKNIEFDIDRPLNESSHSIFKGTQQNKTHFIKKILTPEMAYAEVFLSTLYRYSFLYGIAIAHLLCDETGAPSTIMTQNKKGWAISSKALDNFSTFKQKSLTQKQLDDPLYCERFMEILAGFVRMAEDDGHRGNITIELQLFDCGGAFWQGTRRLQGDRHFADTLKLSRDPQTAFDPGASNIAIFPNRKNVGWYYPSQANPWSEYVSSNPWTSEEIKLISQLEKKSNRLAIWFEVLLDWALDMTYCFNSLAKLALPADLMMPDDSTKSICDFYCDLNKEMNEKYWNVLIGSEDFKKYLEENRASVLIKILVKNIIRSHRLEQDKNLCGDPRFNEKFEAAKRPPQAVIQKFNELLSAMSPKHTYAASSLFSPLSVPDNEIKNNEIQEKQANELIKAAQVIAQQIIELENIYPPENWRPFYEKWYEMKLELIPESFSSYSMHQSPTKKMG